MIYPSFLKESSIIGIPAPSASAEDFLKKNKYNNAIKKWTDLGYQLVLSKNLMNSHMGRSSSAKERGREINEMFKNNEIDGIVCASGGDFLVEMLPFVNFSLLEKNPKLVIGFSDPTGLLFPITTKYDIATIYGSNFSSLGVEKKDKSIEDFIEVIKGNKRIVESYDYYEENRIEEITGLEGHNYTEKVEWKVLNNEKAKITGRIIGGCLDIISELAGTKYDGVSSFNERYKDDGIIWYFDNCELSMEEVIRTLWKLNELDYFKYTKGVIFGRFGVNNTSYGYNTESCLKDSILTNLNIPIIYDADISHKAPCLPIVNGSIAHVTCKNGKGIIEFEYR